MSYTLYPLRKSRLQRSELAVPGSNPTMIEKAAHERRRLRVPRLRGRRRAARQGAGAQEHHPGAERHRLARRRQDRVGAHQRPRHALHVSRRRRHHGAGRLQARHHPHPEGRRAGRRLHGRVHRQPDRSRQGLHQQGRHRGSHRDPARHGQRGSHRRRSEPPRSHALRRRRLRRLQQGAHRRHRRPQPRLPGRPVALRPVAHDGRLPRLRPASDRRPVRRLLRSGRLHRRRQARRRSRHRGQVGDPSLADRARQRGVLADREGSRARRAHPRGAQGSRGAGQGRRFARRQDDRRGIGEDGEEPSRHRRRHQGFRAAKPLKQSDD